MVDYKKKIKEEVTEEIMKDLEKIGKVSGELELNGKEYTVIPIDADFAGFVSKAIDLTIEKTTEKGKDEMKSKPLKKKGCTPSKPDDEYVVLDKGIISDFYTLKKKSPLRKVLK